jgi:hypothetical protein
VTIYRCPACGRDDGLWQQIMVSGWQEIDKHGKKGSRREVDWSWIDEQDSGGCGECGWDGLLSSMELRLGVDGLELPEIHPEQQEIGL